MCLYVNSAYHPEGKPTLAQWNIIVWKVLYYDSSLDRHTSPFRDYPYELGKEMRMDGDVLEAERVLARLVVEDGLHSFKVTDAAAAIKVFCNGNSLQWGWMKVYPAVIPVGSLYYVGQDNDIASDRLVVFPDMLSAIKSCDGKLMRDGAIL